MVDPELRAALDDADYLKSLEASHANLWKAYAESEARICQILGAALGYPWYKDDQENFPGATEADGVCVGDHIAETLASEAADRIKAFKTSAGTLKETSAMHDLTTKEGREAFRQYVVRANDEWWRLEPAQLLKMLALPEEKDAEIATMQKALKEARAVFELLEVSPELKPEGFNAVRAMIIRARITVGAAISPEQEG